MNMKKFVTVLIMMLLFVGGLYMSSCKKCTTCTYTYDVGGQQLSYTYPELCGNKSDIDDYEAVCAQAAAVYGNACTCVDK